MTDATDDQYADPAGLDALLEYVHSTGCTFKVQRSRWASDKGYMHRVRFDAPDGTRYTMERDEIPTDEFPDRDALQELVAALEPVPDECRTCGASLADPDNAGATAKYPYCRVCYATGQAGTDQMRETVKACTALGLQAKVEQTGGGCMNLRVWRDHGEHTPWTYDAEPNVPEHGRGYFVPSVIAVGAYREDPEGEWQAFDATLPDDGSGPWCAWAILTPANAQGEDWPADTLPLAAPALAAFAAEQLPPVPGDLPPRVRSPYVLHVDGQPWMEAWTEEEAQRELRDTTARYPDRTVELVAREAPSA